MQAPPQRERLAPEDREEARHRAELMRDRKRERERERRIDERGKSWQFIVVPSGWGAVLMCGPGAAAVRYQALGQLRKL